MRSHRSPVGRRQRLEIRGRALKRVDHDDLLRRRRETRSPATAPRRRAARPVAEERASRRLQAREPAAGSGIVDSALDCEARSQDDAAKVPGDGRPRRCDRQPERAARVNGNRSSTAAASRTSRRRSPSARSHARQRPPSRRAIPRAGTDWSRARRRSSTAASARPDRASPARARSARARRRCRARPPARTRRFASVYS